VSELPATGDEPLDALIAGLTVDVPDFPSPGVVFRDLTPVFADGHAFRRMVEGLASPSTADPRAAAVAEVAEHPATDPGFDVVVGVDRAGEAEALRALVERAYARYVPRIGRRPAPMDDDYAARVAAGQVDVAGAVRQLLGLIVLVPQRDHLLVENVAVEPAHQGRGVGRALLAHADAVAAAAGLGELRLYTNAAMTENRALYLRLGYRETGRRIEHGFDRVLFTKPAGGRS
jgi:ribosomal protein S18 acetylase RimI-like enzyme